MNFYQHQDRARRRTAFLTCYFLLAVVLIVAALNAVVFVVLNIGADPFVGVDDWLSGVVWRWLTAGIIGVIAGTTLLTTWRLNQGGHVVADMLGARQVNSATGDLKERQYINVVEEMSIASGIPVPSLYVLEQEAGINAFVAGMRPTETVMVLTRGALDAFTRAELQGVVAHEFSHIFNDDIRLNSRLMGALAGIVVIAQIGRLMLHARAGGRDGKSGQWWLVGLAVFALGYIGVFFGALIKAAVSRQREFLADASAVQFTRQPDGIADALLKIQEHAGTSLIQHPRAEDISHFCFAESIRYAFSSLMATHPPLAQRIRAIRPDATRRVAARLPEGRAEAMRADAANIAASVGVVTLAQINFAAALNSALPQQLVTSAHDPSGAQQLVLGLLLHATDPATQAQVLEHIRLFDVGAPAAVAAVAENVGELPPPARLALVNMALPTLKRIDADGRRAFLECVSDVIAADGDSALFGGALLRILTDHLATKAGRAIAVDIMNFAQVRAELQLVLGALARAGTADPEQARAAFKLAWTPFGLAQTDPGNIEQRRTHEIEPALRKLRRLSPLLKRNIIQACADCVIHDGIITPAEGELLQAVALTLDCPLPPLL